MPVPATFARYIALGDSISIDLYPANDVRRRRPGEASSDEVGATSLFFRNDDRLWPEFRNRDLATLYPSLLFDKSRNDLTADGATTHSLLSQVRRVHRSDERTLMTVTAGGNDLLGEIGYRGTADDDHGDTPPRRIFRRFREAIMILLESRPNSVILISTVYDPSDGTNRLPGYPRTLDREAVWLREYNDLLRNLAREDDRLRLADIHAHFLGHGLTAPPAERWYLEESIIEPNARGASEVRRVWLEAIGRYGPGARG